MKYIKPYLMLFITMSRWIVSVPFFATFVDGIIFIGNFGKKFTNPAAERLILLIDV